MNVYILNTHFIRRSNINTRDGISINQVALQDTKYPITPEACKVLVAITLASDGLVARLTQFELASMSGLSLNQVKEATKVLQQNSMLVVGHGYL